MQHVLYSESRYAVETNCSKCVALERGSLAIYTEEKFEAYQRTYVVSSIMSEKDIYLKYIYYYFCAFWNEYNIDKMFGSAIPYIKLGNLQNFEINIPPIEEQYRIVEKLESILPIIESI